MCRPHFNTFLGRLLFVLFSSTKNDSQKKGSNKASRVKVCSVRFRALWSSPRVRVSSLSKKNEEQKRDEEELRHVLHEKNKNKKKKRDGFENNTNNRNDASTHDNSRYNDNKRASENRRKR